MKNITRLIAMVVVLVGLALATGVAYAAQYGQNVVDGNVPASSATADDENVVVIGILTSITTDTMVVSDTTIAIITETVFLDEVTVGDKVRVDAYYTEDGTLTALTVKLCDGVSDRINVKITGPVTAITTDTVTVSDTVIAIVTDTVIIGTIDVGDLVNVHAYTAEDGSLIATLIVQIKGCWDGETGSQGEKAACQHGDERTPPGAGNIYQGENGQANQNQGNEDPGNPDQGNEEPGNPDQGSEQSQDNGNHSKSK